MFLKSSGLYLKGKAWFLSFGRLGGWACDAFILRLFQHTLHGSSRVFEWGFHYCRSKGNFC